MWKKLIPVWMMFLQLFGMVEPVAANTASSAPASFSTDQAVKTRNVALDAQVTASGQCNSNEMGKYAVDGKTDTKWCDNTSATIKWLKLDLGKVYNLNEWTLKNAAINESANSPFWNTKDFRLQKSDDGKTWVDVDVVKDNVQTIVDRYLPEPVAARYIRLYVSKGAYDSNTVRLYELELYGVDEDQIPAYPATNLAPVDYVNPFINTLGDNGQTNPGPTMPFGLVSLGPDSDGGAFSGYYYQDKYLKGFSHLRFNGVGCSGAGGNILMMPETRVFTKNSSEYKQQYIKSSEQASPGYYAVNLASGIGVELTASDNVGFHRYTFPDTSTGSVLVDLSNSYAGMLDANLKVENNNEISGMIKSQNVCGHGYYTMYYSIQFDHDFDSYTSWQGDTTGAVAERTGSNSGVWVNFDTADHKVIQAKVGLSAVSLEQAKYERDHDIANWDFEAQHAKIRNAWSELLNKVEVTDSNEENKKVFYTHLYHTFLHPKNVTSSLGTFKAGRDENTIRQASELGADFQYYNGWTTWDDFRKYALFSVLVPKQYNNMVKSLADLYKTRGSYTQWGDGYWPSPTVRNEFNGAVILDGYAKGFTDIDVHKALQGMAVDADNFSISEDEISGKLEKAKSGYFPMKLAEMIGDQVTYEKYKPLAMSYKNLWNPNQVDENGNKLGFFTPNATTVDKSDVTKVDKFAYQGNLWSYRWSASQDINGLAALMGGKREMAVQLQQFFKNNEYVVINEEDLDAPYLFNYLGMPYLTQYYARQYTTEVVTQKYHNHGAYAYPIKARVYRTDPEGYLPSMDDDAGAMSSWFVYSALGLFPGNPGDANFLIGSPIFSEVKVHLDGGKTFTIKANQVSSTNRFIQSASLNGNNFDQAWIRYADIMAGGTLEFEMGSQPNTDWGASPNSAPPMTDYSANVENTISRQSLIAEGADWKYRDNGQYPGSGWKAANFDDSSWASGPAALGYDNTKYAKTMVSYGPDANNKYTTTYFRKSFEVSDLQGLIELDASLIRDDGAVVYVNGHEVIRTNMPAGHIEYSTFANATVGNERDRNVYSIDPSYLVEGTNVVTAEVHQVNATSSDIAFDFSMEAVKQMVRPDAPSHPVVDDTANTFGWTFVPGYEEAGDYEFSVDGGRSWSAATVNPQTVGPAAYEAGKVQVRVRADESRNRATGQTLVSNAAYTSDIQWNVYDLKADVKRTGNMVVDITGTLKADYTDSAVAVIQLINDEGQTILSSSAPVTVGSFKTSQMFNVHASNYQVNVYLVDAYNGNIYDSLWLAEPIVSHAEPRPEPGQDPDTPGGEDPQPEPKPDPLPIPEPEPELPDVPVEPDPPAEDVKTIQFEDKSEWTTAVNTFNGSPLKTESGNGGTVVANTFTGAWLSYANVDFGTEGANRITVEYTAPSDKTPNDAALEFRLGAADGELVGTLALPNTGTGWGPYQTVAASLSKTITGVQNLYIVMKGSTDSAHRYMGNFDRFTWSYQKTRTDYNKLELESFDEWSAGVNPVNNGPLKTEGGKSGQQVANTYNGAWLAYKGMDFGSAGVNQLSIEYASNSGNCASDSAVEVRLGGVDGTLVGTLAVPPTASGWGTYKTVTGNLTQTLTGIQDVYLVLTGTTDSTFKYLGNFDNASFTSGSMRTDAANLQFESYDEWSTAVNPANNAPLKTETSGSRKQVANTYNGAWLAYKRMDFGSTGANQMSIEYASNSGNCAADSAVEVRLGSVDGTLVGTLAVPPTASGWGTYKTVTGSLTQKITGIQDVYLVFTGTTSSTYKYIGNFDNASFSLLR
ncbi:GH92 family glycosyl hydrolase [Paenibacillus hexagrammi]|uniref:GH92 family glycosyl hydrolase n=1 Tax=Paenibacillus hexagrammi TaxID=2908839 RepID=A0ABY3SDK2_9BACL|nr:GH92 family glycosyl hydrolase [Paenibacillus sp. YPD9-1]UJF31490.1 GH92 family glycosyl hydrolase [Paenibacillus sp. YPD9-1]